MVGEGLRRFIRLFVATGAVTLALAGGPAAADLYRWVDAKGVVNYSNVPPPGIKAKQIAETQPTVSVIPPPERPPEMQQARRETELLRRIGQLEDELAALRRASAAAVVYTHPLPAPAPSVIYSVPVVYPYPIYPWSVYKSGGGHRFQPRHPGRSVHRRHGGGRPIALPHGGRSGLTVRARF